MDGRLKGGSNCDDEKSAPISFVHPVSGLRLPFEFRHPRGDYHTSLKVSILSMDEWEGVHCAEQSCIS